MKNMINTSFDPPFVIIPNKILNNKKLTAEAKVIYALLLLFKKPVTLKQIKQCCKESIDEIKESLYELETEGIIINNQTWVWIKEEK